MAGFIDFEASGAVGGGYPIEVGYCLVEADRSLRSASKLIRHDEWLNELSWDWQAERIHHITRADLMGHGESPLVVMRWLNAQLAGLVVCADSQFDVLWCRDLAGAAGVAPTFRILDIAAAFAGLEIDEARYDRLARRVTSPVAYGREFGRQGDGASLGLRPKTHRAGADAEHLASWYLASLRDDARVHRLYLTDHGHERRSL